jgi:4-methylaminobutanoate oxidase (formaldehyde-forming)
MPCGYKAIESLRLEKGYRAWAGEINTETNPWEAGLGFAVSLKKDNFHGRDALVRAKENVLRTLVAITFENICDVPLGNEAIRIGETVIGRIKSGGQGYTLGKAIAYAYLENSFAPAGTSLEVELFGRWVRGTICAEPLFDPTNERVKS